MEDDQDITSMVHHPCIHRESQSFVSIAEFKIKARIVEIFNDARACNKASVSTNEIWRVIWSTMLSVCFDVRDIGYVLSGQSFEESNLVVVEGRCVKFRKLLAKPLTAENSEDFNEFAKFIESLMEANKLVDVDNFVKLLRNFRSNTTSYRKAHMVCNYSLMSSTIRRDFLIYSSDIAKNVRNFEYNEKMDEICNKYYSSTKWMDIAKQKRHSLVAQVYAIGIYNPDKGRHLLKFIRDALVHLTDFPHNQTAASSWKIMDSYYGNFMSNLQKEMAERGCWKEEDFYRYRGSISYN